MPRLLLPIQAGVSTSQLQQFTVSALLHQTALVHHQDVIGMAKAAETMGYEQHRAAAIHLRQISGDLLFRVDIKGTGGFIENKQPGSLEHHPRNGYALPLPP